MRKGSINLSPELPLSSPSDEAFCQGIATCSPTEYGKVYKETVLRDKSNIPSTKDLMIRSYKKARTPVISARIEYLRSKLNAELEVKGVTKLGVFSDVYELYKRALEYKVVNSRDMERQMKTVCGYASLLLRVSMPVERSRENAPVVVFEEKTEHSDNAIDLGDGE